MAPRALAAVCALALLSACGSHGGAGAIDEGSGGSGYAGIEPEETLRFTGTEPFWDGNIKGAVLTYTTPENPAGVSIPVQRFAGNNGLGFSGNLGGSSFDMAVTNAGCSDGMSDRSYPFTVTLRIGAEVRSGCGWTDRRKFTEPGAG